MAPIFFSGRLRFEGQVVSSLRGILREDRRRYQTAVVDLRIHPGLIHDHNTDNFRGLCWKVSDKRGDILVLCISTLRSNGLGGEYNDAYAGFILEESDLDVHCVFWLLLATTTIQGMKGCPRCFAQFVLPAPYRRQAIGRKKALHSG